MAENNVTTNNGKSKMEGAKHVDMNSVPHCLRHWRNDNILEDAKHLAAFLQRAVEDMASSDSKIGQDDILGFSLAFNLLRDKIDIASGELPFPLSGMEREPNLPDLWTPKE